MKPQRLGGKVRAVSRLCIVYSDICRTTEENHGKTSVKVTEKRSADQRQERDSFGRLGHRGRWPRLACWPLPPLAFASGDGLNPRSARPSCHTRGFPTSVNFESKLTVGALMWSENSGTPRSSCICLLFPYQGTEVAKQRHLDFNTCSLRSRVRAADLHAGHA